MTFATHLFHSEADEQLIMSHTGLEVLMVFAPTSVRVQSRNIIVQLLNATSNGQLVPFESATKKPKLDLVDTEKSGQSFTQHATTHTATAAATAASFNFTVCSSISINYVKDTLIIQSYSDTV